jgi:hypothetical protein
LLTDWTGRVERHVNWFPGVRRLSPVKLIYDALRKCPDEIPTIGTSELPFLKDTALKERLRLDIGAVHHAVANGDWKAATVLGGSVIEALLLWGLQEIGPNDVTKAVQTLTGNKSISKPDTNLEKWDLYCFKEVSTEAGLIKQDTASLIDLTREYRNLIHPGRAQRLKMQCDRATAYTTVAALDRVVDDLTEKFS